MLRAVYQVNFPQYLVRLLLFGLQGLFLLCAITLVISANYNTSFAAVIVSAVCWGMPVILRMLLMGMNAIFIYATPLFLVMHGCLDDAYGAGGIVLCISLLTGIICTVVGFIKYNLNDLHHSVSTYKLHCYDENCEIQSVGDYSPYIRHPGFLSFHPAQLSSLPAYLRHSSVRISYAHCFLFSVFSEYGL